MLNDTIDFADSSPERASRLLEISCNMHKCKYELLKRTIVDSIPSTTILINIESILSQWFRLCGDDCDYSHITSEEIAFRLLEVIGHYRRFYRNYGKCQNVWVFVYGSDSFTRCDKMKLSIYPESISEYAKREITIGLNILQKIMQFIPGIYAGINVIPPEYRSSVIPFYIISRKVQTSMDKSSNDQQRILIVSGNDLDFCGLGLNDVKMNFKIYGFKRKHPTIFTSEDILQKIIFRRRKNPIKSPIRFTEVYPIILFSTIKYIRECEGCFVWSSKTLEIQKWVMRELIRINKLDDSERIESTDVLMREFHDKVNSDVNSEKLYDFVNIPRSTTNIFSTLKDNEIYWKIDLIDFSIEKLNDYQFKNFKIDFQSLL